MTSSPVLVVEHEAQCPLGWLGAWLSEAGSAVDVRRPYRGEEIPGGFGSHSGMVVLGGTMDAYSDQGYPWLTRVKDLVRTAAEDRVPVLGICLGHQLAAVALGGAVARNPRGRQIGLVDVGWTPEASGDPLLHAVCSAAFALQWNDDIVTLPPPGTVVLARTPSGELQAARFAETVWGLQSHPEASADIVARWAENDRDTPAAEGVDVDAYVAQVAAADAELQSAWRPLASRFAAMTGEVARAW